MQFLKLSHELITDTNITANEFRIYTYLLSLYNTSKQCAYPSIETISEKLNISISTVKRSIKKLVDIGYMVIEKRKGLAGNYNTYRNFKYLIRDKMKEKNKKEKNLVILSNLKDNNDKKEMIEICEYSQEHQQKISLILKKGIDLTEKQMFLIGDMNLEILREALRIFTKKKGKKFTFLISIYIDIAEKNFVQISYDIERYLCGSYIRTTQEMRCTQKEFLELNRGL